MLSTTEHELPTVASKCNEDGNTLPRIPPHWQGAWFFLSTVARLLTTGSGLPGTGWVLSLPVRISEQQGGSNTLAVAASLFPHQG